MALQGMSSAVCLAPSDRPQPPTGACAHTWAREGSASSCTRIVGCIFCPSTCTSAGRGHGRKHTASSGSRAACHVPLPCSAWAAQKAGHDLLLLLQRPTPSPKHLQRLPASHQRLRCSLFARRADHPCRRPAAAAPGHSPPASGAGGPQDVGWSSMLECFCCWMCKFKAGAIGARACMGPHEKGALGEQARSTDEQEAVSAPLLSRFSATACGRLPPSPPRLDHAIDLREACWIRQQRKDVGRCCAYDCGASEAG